MLTFLLNIRRRLYNVTHHYVTELVVLADLTPDRRRIVANNYVRYENVTKTDAQVLQCNASNKHGYVFANAYLNVLGQCVFFFLNFVLLSVAVCGVTARIFRFCCNLFYLVSFPGVLMDLIETFVLLHFS